MNIREKMFKHYIGYRMDGQDIILILEWSVSSVGCFYLSDPWTLPFEVVSTRILKWILF